MLLYQKRFFASAIISTLAWSLAQPDTVSAETTQLLPQPQSQSQPNLTPIVQTTSTPISNTSSPYSKILERSWRPSVEFAGDGDPVDAVSNMRSMQELQSTMLLNSDFHQQTEQFIETLWDSFERFNLKKLHQMLPEQDGDWRNLRVVGRKDKDRYKYGPNAHSIGALSIHPTQLGDFHLDLRAKEVTNQVFGSSYLLQSDIEMGIGSINWASITKATQETLRIVTDAKAGLTHSDLAQTELYRQNVKNMNPHLEDNDVAVIAPLWAAFPHSWEMLAKVATVENVVATPVDDGAYQQLQASISIQPQKMRENYPELAKFLTKIGPLLNLKLDLSAEEGRYLVAEIDSKSLTLQLNAFTKDGEVLPVDPAGKFTLKRPVKKTGEPWHFTLNLDATMQVLGVKADVSDVQTQLQYTTQEKGALISSRSNQLPQLNVSGRAMGILPTAVIDFIMPSDIESVMTEFLAVVFNGNDGKGVAIDVSYQQASDKRVANLDTHVSFVGLDNLFVRMGMGIVNNRIIPEDDVSKDIRRLWFDVQHAFASDLNNYAKTVFKDQPNSNLTSQQLDTSQPMLLDKNSSI